MNRTPSNDPRVLQTGNRAGTSRASAPLQGPSMVGNESPAPNNFDNLTFEDFANTAPQAVARKLHSKHQRNTLARVNQDKYAVTRKIPVVVSFSRNQPGSVRVAANPYAMGTESLMKGGQRVTHDLSNCVVFDVHADATNTSQESVGLKLNSIPGTMFPNASTDEMRDHPGYQEVLLPGQTKTGIPLHVAQATDSPGQLARRMISTLGVNMTKADMDKAITIHSDQNGRNTYMAIDPDNELGKTLRRMAFHPKDNASGKFLITNSKTIPEEHANKRIIRVNGYTGQLLVGNDDMEHIREMLGGTPVTDSEREKNARSGWMDLGNLALQASVVPSGEQNVGTAYDAESDPDELHKVHAVVTIRYIPFSAAAEHVGQAIANDIKTTFANSSGSGKRK